MKYLSFQKRCVQRIRLEIPWWIAIIGLYLIIAPIILIMTGFNVIIPLMILIIYVWIGKFIVFKLLNEKREQNNEQIDFKGAARDVYRAVWWPWYLRRELSRKR
jgi:fatty acid desaturase